MAERLDRLAESVTRRTSSVAPGALADSFDPRKLLETLVRHGVDFVLIGGMAGVARGSAYVTLDVDVAYDRSQANLERLAEALESWRDAPRSPARPPIRARRRDARERRERHVRHPVRTARHPLRPGRRAGLRDARATKRARNCSSRESAIRVASLDHLIAMKEASGRPKDLLMASEYRVISDELRRTD